MKRFLYVLAAALLLIILVSVPNYWTVFQSDKSQYKTETFYYVIKEEYEENRHGQRVYHPKFTDIQDGDILVTDSTYCLCFRHGHAAIVTDAEKGITLEAFGIGTESEYSELREWQRYPHVLVLRLKAPEKIRRTVAEYAKKHLVNVSYMLSPGVIDDKDMDGEYWGTQCAHLVWAAFRACGYDIDGNGGWLVIPEDFTKSEMLFAVPQE